MRSLERYARNIRNENRATITTHKNAPKKNEGVDGDIRITTTITEGVKLFSKYQGQWYSTPLSKHVVKDKRIVTPTTLVKSEGVEVNCKIKIFQGTSAAVNNAEKITHGIADGKKRIAMVSISISSDNTPSLDSNSPPSDSFLAGGGCVQDDIDEDRQFQTYYDDTYIYIVTDSEASDIASNQYVCTVWHTEEDIY